MARGPTVVASFALPCGAAARAALLVLAAAVLVASVTGLLLYCYSSTLAAWCGAMALTHDLSGNRALLASGVYLALHLARVWRLTRLRLSWWSGLTGLAMLALSGVTGVWGQLQPLGAGTPVWHAHVWSSLLAIVTACFHGVWGLRPRCQ